MEKPQPRVASKRRPPSGGPPNRFMRARDDRQAETAEDYVELIAELIRRNGQARAADVARSLGVTHVTVLKTVARLARDGLVTSEPYRAIFLTERGRALAEHSRTRHQIVARFLLAIGVDAETAHADAEGMEHHASQETLRAFERLTRELTRK
ncbi:MAG: manganese-binding transcriptional regulator MntR [Acidisphaera sp.]|nr:manganese-binding transcriptional regulator MntR [Acidisphaera sp.]